MTNPDLTHLALVLDRSGSMQQNDKATEAEAGVRRLLAEQRELPGGLDVSVTRFDNRYEFKAGDISDDDLRIEPGGMTALYDALGRTITTLGSQFAGKSEDERPGKVIVVIATDGMENASREWTATTIGAKIEQQRQTYSWEFVFLGTSEHQMLSAVEPGVAQSSSIAAADSGPGLRSAYQSTSSAILRSRTTGHSIEFTDEERTSAREA